MLFIIHNYFSWKYSQCWNKTYNIWRIPLCIFALFHISSLFWSVINVKQPWLQLQCKCICCDINSIAKCLAGCIFIHTHRPAQSLTLCNWINSSPHHVKIFASSHWDAWQALFTRQTIRETNDWNQVSFFTEWEGRTIKTILLMFHVSRNLEGTREEKSLPSFHSSATNFSVDWCRSVATLSFRGSMFFINHSSAL